MALTSVIKWESDSIAQTHHLWKYGSKIYLKVKEIMSQKALTKNIPNFSIKYLSLRPWPVPSGHLMSKWRRINVDATWFVNTTSFSQQMPAGVGCSQDWSRCWIKFRTIIFHHISYNSNQSKGSENMRSYKRFNKRLLIGDFEVHDLDL